MKAFLWHDVDVVSNNYHSDGSVLIEAETIERAREIGFFESTEYVVGKVIQKMDIDKEPSAIFESSSKEEKVWVFPNAGCC